MGTPSWLYRHPVNPARMSGCLAIRASIAGESWEKRMPILSLSKTIAVDVDLTNLARLIEGSKVPSHIQQFIDLQNDPAMPYSAVLQEQIAAARHAASMNAIAAQTILDAIPDEDMHDQVLDAVEAEMVKRNHLRFLLDGPNDVNVPALIDTLDAPEEPAVLGAGVGLLKDNGGSLSFPNYPLIPVLDALFGAPDVVLNLDR